MNNTNAKAIDLSNSVNSQLKKSSENVAFNLFFKTIVTRKNVKKVNDYFQSELVTIEGNKVVIDGEIAKYIIKNNIVSVLTSLAPDAIRNSSILNKILEIAVDEAITIPLKLLYNISKSNNFPVSFRGEFLEYSKEQRHHDVVEGVHNVVTLVGPPIVESVICESFKIGLQTAHLTLTRIHPLATSNSTSFIANVTSTFFNSLIESLDLGIRQVQTKLPQRSARNKTV